MSASDVIVAFFVTAICFALNIAIDVYSGSFKSNPQRQIKIAGFSAFLCLSIFIIFCLLLPTS